MPKVFTLRVALFAAIGIVQGGSPLACESQLRSGADTKELAKYVEALNRFGSDSDEPLFSMPLDTERYFVVDRANSNYSVFAVLNAQGILTATPAPRRSALASFQAGYAHGIQFTRCHWITNLHVVKGIAQERGEQLKLGTSVFGSFGQGGSCPKDDDFISSGIRATLVGFDSRVFEEGTGELINNYDWAVVRTDLPSPIQPVRICDESLTTEQMGVLFGTPGSRIGQFSLPTMGGKLVRAQKGTGTGLLLLTKRTNEPGLSGGGVYKVDDKGLCLAALNVGSGQVIKMSTIFRTIKGNADLTRDILRASKTGMCAP